MRLEGWRGNRNRSQPLHQRLDRRALPLHTGGKPELHQGAVQIVAGALGGFAGAPVVGLS
jgi:hypothetical protein